MTIGGKNGAFVFVALFACWSGCLLQQVTALITNPADLVALNSLKDAWNGVNKIIPWSGDDPCLDPSNWPGVVCDKNGAVASLTLLNMDLKGKIPATIGNFTSLQSLELSGNPNLGGTLPKELGLLTELSYLSIQQCAIEGTIPTELSNLVKLEFLALNGNKLFGAIPPALGKLKSLIWFDISLNQISGGLPVSSNSRDSVGLDSLRKIKHFHFNNNSMGGDIPHEIFNIPSLIHLLLDSNQFSGSIPSNISLPKLVILRLDNNNLAGPIPASLGDVKNLTEIHLSNNQLEETIPDLSGLTNLKLLDLSNNAFPSQPVPSFLAGMKKLQTILLRGANLEGAVPTELFQIPTIEKIDMSENSLNDSLRLETGVGPYLEYVNLEKNQIQDVIGKPMVKEFLLARNPYCTRTADPYYCDADSGVLTTWLSKNCYGYSCRDGKVLNGNDCTCGNALVCEMQLNSPPYQIVDEDKIQNLTFTLQMFFTTKAYAEYNLTAAARGQVTLDRSQLFIGSANFTWNGRLKFRLDFFPPADSWKRDEVDFIVKFLYNNTIHLPATHGPYNILSYIKPHMTSSTSLSVGALIGIIAGAVFAVIIAAIIAVYACRQKRRADKAQPFASWGGSGGADNGAAPQLKGARFFSVSELKKATNSFSERNEIGSGGYGKVYRGTLADGVVVAVKRAEQGSMQGAPEFKTEIELLSRVHHRNLVGLLGFSYESGEQMLVYEFMPNGTVRDLLLGSGTTPLTWQRRLNIALGSAKGLSYLHEEANPPLIHRDIKSTNILLDDSMVAKVADFGLSKLAPENNGAGKAHVSTQVKGTLGYLDPEYYMTNKLSEKSDVYSFGVVMLELLTARAPIEGGKYIVREVRNALDRGGIAGGLRPMLDRSINECPTSELEDFVKLALACVEEAADDRPTMNEVVKDLERIGGHSFAGSVDGSKPRKDLYGDSGIFGNETQFQYSGGYGSTTIEPK